MNFKKRMLSAIDIPSLFILLFIIGWVAFLVLDSVLPPKRNIPSQPLSEIISEIERSGRDANCEDFIGRWYVLEFRDHWEVQANGKFTAKRGLSRAWGNYSCDDTNRTYKVPYFGVDEWGTQMTNWLGLIHEDRMIVYIDEERTIPRILIRETEDLN